MFSVLYCSASTRRKALNSTQTSVAHVSNCPANGEFEAPPHGMQPFLSCPPSHIRNAHASGESVNRSTVKDSSPKQRIVRMSGVFTGARCSGPKRPVSGIYVNYSDRPLNHPSTLERILPKRAARTHQPPSRAGGQRLGSVQSKKSGSGARSGSGAAGAIGGARDGRPRHSRIARVVSGGWIAARILMGPWQTGHSRTSTANTRLMSSAQP